MFCLIWNTFDSLFKKCNENREIEVNVTGREKFKMEKIFTALYRLKNDFEKKISCINNGSSFRLILINFQPKKLHKTQINIINFTTMRFIFFFWMSSCLHFKSCLQNIVENHFGFIKLSLGTNSQSTFLNNFSNVYIALRMLYYAREQLTTALTNEYFSHSNA